MPANGVFLDLWSNTKLRGVSSAYIDSHDGSSWTLLLSENLDAGAWDSQESETAQTTLGFVWHEAAGAARAINGRSATATADDLARPSSNHGQGVHVSFCDGSTRFLREDIDYDVYKQLMTTFGKGSDDSVNRIVFDSDL